MELNKLTRYLEFFSKAFDQKEVQVERAGDGFRLNDPEGFSLASVDLASEHVWIRLDRTAFPNAEETIQAISEGRFGGLE